jgi:hypothetical protein
VFSIILKFKATGLDRAKPLFQVDMTVASVQKFKHATTKFLTLRCLLVKAFCVISNSVVYQSFSNLKVYPNILSGMKSEKIKKKKIVDILPFSFWVATQISSR